MIFPATRPDRTHFANLNGLRGVAILMVLFFHFSDFPPPTTEVGRVLLRIVCCGWIGVDLFFVLSGFLITSVLLESRTATNYFKIFYIRRALRLFPVYYLAVILMFWVLMPLSHRHDLLDGFFTRYPLGEGRLSEQLWYWLNISNLHTAFYPLRIPLLSIFWSLAVEEQFYLFWPACVRFLRPRSLILGCLLGVVLSAVLRNLPVVLAEDHLYYNFIYRMTPLHADGLLCGAALAALFQAGWKSRHITTIPAFALPPLVFALVFFLWSPEQEVLWRNRAVYSLLALLFTTVIWLAIVADHRSWTSRVLGSSFLRSLGRYSYFIYVFHLWVITYLAVTRDSYLKQLWPFNSGPLGSYIATALLAFALVYALGALSWRFFEGPILGNKRHFSYALPSDPAKIPSNV